MKINQYSFPSHRPVLLLAPMQDVTDLPFWRVMHRYGGPDIYFTEYFRVHSTSSLEPHILEAIRNSPEQKPVIAQMIGQDIPSLLRTVDQLQKESLLAIDINIGCPAPSYVVNPLAAVCSATSIISTKSSAPCVRLFPFLSPSKPASDSTTPPNLTASSISINPMPSTPSPSMDAPLKKCIVPRSTTISSPRPSNA
ncbi:MAG: hypothetical protein HC904_14370 [Blastochloris sp.]|nr:hypothetical protein [Blastochloris sp.]